MKRICVLTASRSEYGLLKPLIKRLLMVSDFEVKIAVTGSHLSDDFGMTYKEIENDGISIDAKIPILNGNDKPSDISKVMGAALIKFSDYFEKLKPDLLIVLGDRYETLSVCCAALNQLIPIAHLHGGEITIGATDESFRHAITKMSHLHFASTELYRKRIIQMGENPRNVFNVGALGVENILNEKLLDKKTVIRNLSISSNNPYIVVTFHPVTLEGNTAKIQFSSILEVCKNHPEISFVFTKTNADSNGSVINRMIDEYIDNNSNAVAFKSLGMVYYLSTVKYCCAVMGNSSSGIIEAPSFKVPTINIGDRQKGRLQSDTIINCEPYTSDIESALSLALSADFKNKIENSINPYGKGNTSEEVVDILKDRLLNDSIDLKKEFHDL